MISNNFVFLGWISTFIHKFKNNISVYANMFQKTTQNPVDIWIGWRSAKDTRNILTLRLVQLVYALSAVYGFGVGNYGLELWNKSIPLKMLMLKNIETWGKVTNMTNTTQSGEIRINGLGFGFVTLFLFYYINSNALLAFINYKLFRVTYQYIF